MLYNLQLKPEKSCLEMGDFAEVLGKNEIISYGDNVVLEVYAPNAKFYSKKGAFVAPKLIPLIPTQRLRLYTKSSSSVFKTLLEKAVASHCSAE